MKVIVNPAAGKNTARDTWTKLERRLREKNIFHSVDFTEKPAGMVLLAKEAAVNHSDKVIVVGGDGTVNEALNGIAGTQTVLGIIPAGSGNDIAMTLGLSVPNGSCFDAVTDGSVKVIDTGRVNGRSFAGSVGIGIDAEAAYEAAKNTSLKGLKLYVYSLLKVIITGKPAFIELVIDGVQQDFYAWLVAINNCPTYGGGFKINPFAVMDDGLLDICVIKKIAKWRVLYYLPMVVIGKHGLLKHATFFRGKNIVVKTPGLKAEVDGEIVTSDEFRIEVVPLSQKVLVPKGS